MLAGATAPNEPNIADARSAQSLAAGVEIQTPFSLHPHRQSLADTTDSGALPPTALGTTLTALLGNAAPNVDLYMYPGLRNLTQIS